MKIENFKQTVKNVTNFSTGTFHNGINGVPLEDLNRSIHSSVKDDVIQRPRRTRDRLVERYLDTERKMNDLGTQILQPICFFFCGLPYPQMQSGTRADNNA